jgi:hypothetical protein
METFGKSRKVMSMVRFTRTLYAMLSKQQFDLPIFGAPLHPSHPDSKAFDLGAKLVRFKEHYVVLICEQTCGFEILYQESKQASKFGQDKDWKVYSNYLKKQGFYQVGQSKAIFTNIRITQLTQKSMYS